MNRSMSLTVALLPSLALAAGFALPEQSARAVAEAGTGTAASEGGDSLYYNPGRTAFADGAFGLVSGTMILPTFAWRAPEDVEDTNRIGVEQRLFVQPSVFVGAPVLPGLQVGLGAFSNFGLGVEWPQDFPGRFDSARAEIVTYTFNPSLAYRITPWLGVGGGANIVRATVELEQQLGFPDAEGRLALGGGTWSAGGNAGVAANFFEDRLGVGVNWRSAVPLTFEGRADFQGAPREFQSSLRDQPVRTSITLPHLFSAGAVYRFTERAKVTVDVNYTTWSSLQALGIEFPETPELNQNLERNWENTVTVRAGGSLGLTNTLAVRLGAGYDPSPSPPQTVAPSLPDSDRILGSLGLGYDNGPIQADLGYLFVYVTPRTTTGEAFPARYTGNAHLVGLSIGAQL